MSTNNNPEAYTKFIWTELFSKLPASEWISDKLAEEIFHWPAKEEEFPRNVDIAAIKLAYTLGYWRNANLNFV